MHSTLPQHPAGTSPAPGSLRRLLGDLLERIENSASITGDILQILKAPDGPLRVDDRAVLAIEVAALREDIARDLAGDDTDLRVILERVGRELAAISATLTAPPATTATVPPSPAQCASSAPGAASSSR
ncbi:MAG: hypothetical protein ABSF03_20305 [Streptosporangiaceae bacterium]|jgi:hypothetical protein